MGHGAWVQGWAARGGMGEGGCPCQKQKWWWEARKVGPGTTPGHSPSVAASAHTTCLRNCHHRRVSGQRRERVCTAIHTCPQNPHHCATSQPHPAHTPQGQDGKTRTCISWRSTLPSLVSLTPPAPSTNIFSVPRGPRLLFSTSPKPRAADTLIASACAWRVRSALGLIADIALMIGGGSVDEGMKLGSLVSCQDGWAVSTEQV
jgi:hypothetical protein